MDLSPILNEFDTPFLVDSGTESYTESPIAEEESEHSEDSTVDDNTRDPRNGLDLGIATEKPQIHILDKKVSVDEDVLIAALEPIRLNNNTVQCTQPNDNSTAGPTGSSPLPGVSITDEDLRNFLDDDEDDQHNFFQDDTVLTSILRRESTSSISLRKVSFPTNETELATYREPENDLPWAISTYLPAEKILQVYQSSCKQHQTIELDVIKNFVSEIKDNTNHSAILNLTQLNITNEVNETIEDLLKVSNFRCLILNECKFTLETISEFLNMLEYYSSICEVEVMMNFEDVEAWKCFCNACSNIIVLECVSFKNMTITENYMRMILNAVKLNSKITTLRFDACSKLPSTYLVESLMNNNTLQELYLPSTGLYTKEADCLGRFLQKNSTLKVLDISNNCIGDRGLEVLAKGLTHLHHLDTGSGLSVLVVFNNQITEKSGQVINNIIMGCKNLHTLNIGYNNLTDEVLRNISSSLAFTTSLEGLGLQCTLLTCKGIDFLAEAIENNTSLQKINLKGNKAIQVPGLERLCQALTTSKISKIEIDATNRSANDPHAYVQLVKKINGICTVNRTMKETSSDELSKLLSRKVSLSCEPRYLVPEPPTFRESTIVSPVPSRTTSSTSRSRFQITRVEDRSSSSSRFKVTPVPPDEDLVTGKFANVRSSVSSNDSVESLQIDTDSD